jgi:hypothetical protein
MLGHLELLEEGRDRAVAEGGPVVVSVPFAPGDRVAVVAALVGQAGTWVHGLGLGSAVILCEDFVARTKLS